MNITQWEGGKGLHIALTEEQTLIHSRNTNSTYRKLAEPIRPRTKQILQNYQLLDTNTSNDRTKCKILDTCCYCKPPKREVFQGICALQNSTTKAEKKIKKKKSRPLKTPKKDSSSRKSTQETYSWKKH
jgi:hypothetical protein